MYDVNDKVPRDTLKETVQLDDDNFYTCEAKPVRRLIKGTF